MKRVTIISILIPISLAFASGCAGSVHGAAKAPVKNTASVVADNDLDVAVPYFDSAPPGSMAVSWQPTAPPPPRQVKARKLVAKPHFVSNKGTRGRLFVLPTTFEH